jgi:Cysteine-rich secretory protein family
MRLARTASVFAITVLAFVPAACSSSGSGTNGSTGGGSSSGAGDGYAAARQQCVQIINMYRSTVSPPSPTLSENTGQEACVDGQAKADATSGTPHSAFGNCGESAQNECPMWPGPPSSIMTNCLAQMWMEGPPPQGQDDHWLNMENPQYTQVACGFYQDSQGTWWATQNFW